MSGKKVKLLFIKMQGVGNDFILIQSSREDEQDWGLLAQQMCERRIGIGADGLLVVFPASTADIAMRMYNSDGTLDVCGNGMRCVARYAVDHPGPWQESIQKSGLLRIETQEGIRTAHYLKKANRDMLIAVEMGKPDFSPQRIPVSGASEPLLSYDLLLPGDTTFPLQISAVWTGSAHAVTFVNELPDDPVFYTLSPLTENHPIFPERVSLLWTKLMEPGAAELRIWERGVGETWGCGTGACAVAAVIHEIFGWEYPICVRSRGGELVISIMPDGGLLMEGPAEYVFEGVYPLNK
jgi:diaminopimelate epimerase